MPRREGFSRAISVRVLPAFTQKAVPAEAEPCREWEAGLKLITRVREQLDAAGRHEELLLSLGDGRYDCVDIWRGLALPVEELMAWSWQRWEWRWPIAR